MISGGVRENSRRVEDDSLLQCLEEVHDGKTEKGLGNRVLAVTCGMGDSNYTYFWTIL